MASVIFIDQNYEDWQVVLMSDDCIVKIYSCGGVVEVALSTLQLYNTIELFELNNLIGWILAKRNFLDPPAQPQMDSAQSVQGISRRLENIWMKA